MYALKNEKSWKRSRNQWSSNGRSISPYQFFVQMYIHLYIIFLWKSERIFFLYRPKKKKWNRSFSDIMHLLRLPFLYSLHFTLWWFNFFSFSDVDISKGVKINKKSLLLRCLTTLVVMKFLHLIDLYICDSYNKIRSYSKSINFKIFNKFKC